MSRKLPILLTPLIGEVTNRLQKAVFAKENVETYFLEFDDERSGNFEPLRFVPKNKNVVLGLVTSKKPQLEDKGEVKKRIQEAAKYVDLERLSLSSAVWLCIYRRGEHSYRRRPVEEDAAGTGNLKRSVGVSSFFILQKNQESGSIAHS